MDQSMGTESGIFLFIRRNADESAAGERREKIHPFFSWVPSAIGSGPAPAAGGRAGSHSGNAGSYGYAGGIL